MSFRDEGGRLIFELPDGTSYRLVDDISSPEIANKGNGSFHPMNADWVIDALSQIDVSGSNLNLSASVFVLPFPRSGFPASSTCGHNVFLSPGVSEMSKYAIAFTVAHEIGHVFQQRYAAQESGDAWPEYLKLRGIYDDSRYAEDSPHMNRPVEIFAEDFRCLFGGAEARYSGTIENPNIPLPGDVPGLEAFFVGLVAAGEFTTAESGERGALSLSNYPNPFNPSTTIHLAFDRRSFAAEKEIDVSIYRVDGTLVRNLCHGRITGDEYSIRWDGRDAAGREAASGVYFYFVRYSLRSESKSATGKMLLMR